MATTPNFTWPTPNDTDQLADGAAAIRALGDAADATVYAQSTAIAANGSAISTLQTDVAAKLPLAGGTVTGNIVAQNVSLEVSAAGSDTINLDFSTDGFVTRNVSGTAITVTASNYAEGRTKTLRLVGGTAVASLTLPSDWTFVGSAAGTALGTAITAMISATAFGTAATDVVAAFAEEA